MLAFAINNISLLVHHIIILKQALTNAEIVFLNLLLCALNAVADHAVLDHITFLVSQFIHQSGNSLATEHAHQIVFERNIELRSARIALATGTTTKLSVNTSAFMSFRTDDRKSSSFLHSRSEFDIRTTTRHVGGDGYRTRKASLSYNLRFPR